MKVPCKPISPHLDRVTGQALRYWCSGCWLWFSFDCRSDVCKRKHFKPLFCIFLYFCFVLCFGCGFFLSKRMKKCHFPFLSQAGESGHHGRSLSCKVHPLAEGRRLDCRTVLTTAVFPSRRVQGVSWVCASGRQGSLMIIVTGWFLFFFSNRYLWFNNAFTISSGLNLILGLLFFEVMPLKCSFHRVECDAV